MVHCGLFSGWDAVIHDWNDNDKKPSQLNLNSLILEGEDSLPGFVKYKVHPLHQEFGLIQIIMVFPLKQHSSDVSAEVFDLFRNGKLQHFKSSSCWDRNKHHSSLIWPFWFSRPSLKGSERPVWEAPCSHPEPQFTSWVRTWRGSWEGSFGSVSFRVCAETARTETSQHLITTSPSSSVLRDWGVGDDLQRYHRPHLPSTIHS